MAMVKPVTKLRPSIADICAGACPARKPELTNFGIGTLARGFHLLEGGCDDAAEPFGGLVVLEFRRPQPARLGELLVELKLAGDPARGKAKNDEMALGAPVAVARHHLAMAGERHRLDRHAGFLVDFAHQRFVEGLAG